ncbi:MAG: Hsp20/alpha crystallin family protein [Candidatus Brocadiaceae bacterium]
MDQEGMWRQMRKQLEEVADTIDGALRRVPGVGSFVRPRYPAVDVYESGDELVVRAEVPGLSREALDVSLRGQTLIIKGSAPEDRYEDYTCHARERGAGEFCREVPLPAAVDEEGQIIATLVDGILTVRLKKTQPQGGRKIDIEGD